MTPDTAGKLACFVIFNGSVHPNGGGKIFLFGGDFFLPLRGDVQSGNGRNFGEIRGESKISFHGNGGMGLLTDTVAPAGEAIAGGGNCPQNVGVLPRRKEFVPAGMPLNAPRARRRNGKRQPVPPLEKSGDDTGRRICAVGAGGCGEPVAPADKAVAGIGDRGDGSPAFAFREGLYRLPLQSTALGGGIAKGKKGRGLSSGRIPGGLAPASHGENKQKQTEKRGSASAARRRSFQKGRKSHFSFREVKIPLPFYRSVL